MKEAAQKLFVSAAAKFSVVAPVSTVRSIQVPNIFVAMPAVLSVGSCVPADRWRVRVATVDQRDSSGLASLHVENIRAPRRRPTVAPGCARSSAARGWRRRAWVPRTNAARCMHGLSHTTAAAGGGAPREGGSRHYAKTPNDSWSSWWPLHVRSCRRQCPVPKWIYTAAARGTGRRPRARPVPVARRVTRKDEGAWRAWPAACTQPST